jgi:chromosome segregation ATPase
MDPLPVLESERVPRSSRCRQVFEMDETVQAQIARLTSDVQHVQTDVADLKVGLRRVEDRLDTMNGRIDGVNTNIYRLEVKLTDKMEGIRSEQAGKTEAVRSDLSGAIERFRSEFNEKLDSFRSGFNEKLDSFRSEFNEKIDGLRSEFNEKIDGLRSEIDGLRSEISSLKVWALTLYIAQAGSLLFVMAKGFKWL